MAQKCYANGRIGSITCDSNFLMLLASNAQIGKVFTDVYILCNGWGYELWKMSMMAISFAGLHLMCLIELPPPQPQCILGTIRETREHRKHTRNTQTQSRGEHGWPTPTGEALKRRWCRFIDHSNFRQKASLSGHKVVKSWETFQYKFNSSINRGLRALNLRLSNYLVVTRTSWATL